VRRAGRSKDPNALALERDLSARLGLNVTLRPQGDGGTITIAYHSLAQLDGLLRRLG
jgi:ParB family chromosome partitioning protein